MFEKIKLDVEVDDEEFDLLFPKTMREAAAFHFTPVHVARDAARFLVQEEGTKVLDIGSGAGKFCLIGAACTDGYFTGVEQRKALCEVAEGLAKKYDLKNTNFLHGNITNLNFSDYDAFYIFNPFMEHRTPDESFDANLDLDNELYYLYSDFVKQQLDRLQVGTRLVTYFSYGDEVPESYARIGGDEDGKVRLWIRG